MGSSNFVFDVSESTFEVDVVNRSYETPVLADFWAPWCGPCRSLGPVLEKLAAESDGGFFLAKVNVDENPNLSVRFGVQGIPAVKAFRNGQVINGFVGAIPEPRVREFLQKVAPNETDHTLAEAISLLATRHWADAEEKLRVILEAQPRNAAAALGMVRALVAQGKGREALEIIEDFTSGPEIVAAEQLRPLAEMLAEVAEDNDHRTESDLQLAQYWQSARLLANGRYAAGMDGLMEVLRKDKKFRGGEPRKVMLGVFALLGDDDPLTREYRGELASVLF